MLAIEPADRYAGPMAFTLLFLLHRITRGLFSLPDGICLHNIFQARLSALPLRRPRRALQSAGIFAASPHFTSFAFHDAGRDG